MVEQPEELRVLGVLGPVVDDEERQRLARVDVVRRPDEAADGADAPRSQLEASEIARRRLVVLDPGGRSVAGELDDRLRAERARRPKRIGRIGDELGRPVGARKLEEVLEPLRVRPREAKRPLAAAGSFERGAARPAELVREGDADHRPPHVAVRERDVRLEHDRSGRGLHAHGRRG